MNDLIIIFFTIASILALGFIGDALSRKVMVPSVIMLMILGIVVGPILHVFQYDLIVEMVSIIAPLTLAFISLEAGMSMDIRDVLKQSGRVAVISIFGFVFSMVAVGSLLHFALSIRWAHAFLMASAWSGMNVAIVNAVFSYIKPREETRLTFTMISLVDDPLVLVSTLTILDYVLLGSTNFGQILTSISFGVGMSLFLGASLGLGWLLVLYSLRKSEYTYTFTLAAFLFVYALSESFGGTGVISVFIFGLVLANYWIILRRFKSRRSMIEFSQLKENVDRFNKELTFILSSFFFTFIGLIYVFTDIYVILLGLACSLLLHLTKYIVTKIGTFRSPMAADLPMIGLIVGQGASSASMSMLFLVYGLPNATLLTSLALNMILFNNITSIVLPFAAAKFTKKI